MSKRIYNKLNVGDLFTVPSSDGGYYVGQIIYKWDDISNVFVYFFDLDRISSESLPDSFDVTQCEVILGSFITVENLIKNWKIIGNQSYVKHPVLEKVERIKAGNRNGAETIGGGLVAKFLDTYFGVLDIDSWPDPAFVLSCFIREMKK